MGLQMKVFEQPENRNLFLRCGFLWLLAFDFLITRTSDCFETQAPRIVKMGRFEVVRVDFGRFCAILGREFPEIMVFGIVRCCEEIFATGCFCWARNGPNYMSRKYFRSSAHFGDLRLNFHFGCFSRLPRATCRLMTRLTNRQS